MGISYDSVHYEIANTVLNLQLHSLLPSFPCINLCAGGTKMQGKDATEGNKGAIKLIGMYPLTW